MVHEIRYTSMRRVLDNLLDHPLLSELTLEQAVRFAIRFISIHGYPKLYQDKVDRVEVRDFRGALPCDCVSIVQVKDASTGICLRAMTDSFPTGMTEHSAPQMPPRRPDVHGEVRPDKWYIPKDNRHLEEPSFKTQGRVIYTSFAEGMLEIAYKAIPVDEDGFPLLLDDETYLDALEAYIKMKAFAVRFETGKMAASIYQNAQQEYAWASGRLSSHMTIPSVSEMESITRMWNTLIPRMTEFDDGFRHLGDREYLRRH